MNDPNWHKDAVVYLLDIKSFKDSDADGFGDFLGLTSKLDYVRDLGANCLCLLPFYPSPLNADGFDIADHRAVHPSVGSLRQFKAFLREAHARGLRVLIDFVLDNTSAEHKWFQRARTSSPGSAARKYYVWSDRPDKYVEASVLRFESERSNWTWDDKAGAFYWHRATAFQPALNYDNPVVIRQMISAMAHWLKHGVDGFRLHGVRYLISREGTRCEDLPETHAVLQQMRLQLSQKYPECVLASVVDAWPEDLKSYFGDRDGDECHVVQYSPLPARLFMSLQTEDRSSMVDFLSQTMHIPESCQLGSFLRDQDALSLLAATTEERDAFWLSYAPDGRARHHSGVRRRLAPLLDYDERRIKLMYALLLSLPGAPILYYGDEIGMGENLFLPDCGGLRTPMQWNADRNAGFSRAESARLYRPVLSDSPGGYEAANAERQMRNGSSLLNSLRRMIACRNQHPALARGDLTILGPGNHKVLAYIRHFEEEAFLCVANLSRASQSVELNLAPFHGTIPVDVFSQTYFPPIGELPYHLTLGAHDFYWRLLRGDIERMTCFISFSSQDEDLAEKLFRDLQAMSIECWKAPGDLSIGESFEERIALTVRRCDRLVVILSKDAIDSEWVKFEVETALAQERDGPDHPVKVLPVRIDDTFHQNETGWVRDCGKRHMGDFRDWRNAPSYQAGLEKLLDAMGSSGRPRRLEGIPGQSDGPGGE
jgi:maltose alpha-D-glucosyltransferase/alpha-amylase